MIENSTFWWDTKEDVHTEIWKEVDILCQQQQTRIEKQVLLNLTYGDPDTNISSYPLLKNIEELSNLTKNQLSFNLIQSIIDTKTSKLLKSFPMPMFVTDGANWNSQILSRNLNKAASGLFYDLKIEKLMSKIYLHCQLFGTGALKCFEEDDRVRVEVVSPTKLLVDLVDAQNGSPRTLYQIEYISREVLKSRYHKHSKEISESKTITDATQMSNTDYVTIIEAWHLGTKSSLGRHCIVLESCTLLDEDYKEESFPFVFLKTTEKQSGFWGQGAAERCFNKHIETKKTLTTIKKCVHLGLVPTIYVDEASEVVSSHLNNDIGNIIKYRGTPPIDKPLFNVPQQLFDWLKFLMESSYEEEGVSMLSAQSKKPSGLDAAVAIREYNDIESERFYMEGKAIEFFSIELTHKLLKMITDITKRTGKSYPVKSINGNVFSSIDFKNLDLANSSYVIKCFPVSSLPQHPAARKQEISEYMQMGFITQDVAMKLMNIPDIADEMDKKLSSQLLIDKIIDNIMYEDDEVNGQKVIKYDPPQLTYDLDYAIMRFQQAYNYYKLKDADEERINALYEWIKSANELLIKSAPKAPNITPEIMQQMMQGQAPQEAMEVQ